MKIKKNLKGKWFQIDFIVSLMLCNENYEAILRQFNLTKNELKLKMSKMLVCTTSNSANQVYLDFI